MLLFGEDKIKAVAYYRHSAEDKQENSVAIQREQVEKFAAKENILILEHFQDEGVSGLTANRPGFQTMFTKWIMSADAPDIDYILVYDASRFGRFQEMSEVWRWLGLCEARGIKLASVIRGLPNNQKSVVDSFIITLDFSMSGEFSKVLSDKVAYGSMKVAEQGYSAGGSAPYGYTRVLLSEQRERIGILQRGEHKVISNQRVTFEPAANNEPKVVQRIFCEFVAGHFPDDIAERLNDDGITSAKGKTWNKEKVIRILTNEVYMGTRVYNKTWKRLKAAKHRNNPPSEWVRCLNAHEALVDADTFHKTQERLYWLRPRSRNQSVRRLRVAQAYVTKYIEQLIAGFDDDQRFYIRRYLPVSFGATYTRNNEQRTCFYLAPQQKVYGAVLLCAIDTNDGTTAGLQAVYRIKGEEVGNRSFVIVSDSTPPAPIPHDELEGVLLSMVSNVVTHHMPRSEPAIITA